MCIFLCSHFFFYISEGTQFMLQILNGTRVAAIQGETCQQMYGFLADKTR